MMLRFKEIPKTPKKKKNVSRLHPGSLTVCPFKKYHLKRIRRIEPTQKPIIVQGRCYGIQQLGGVLLNAKNFFVAAKSELFRSKPLHGIMTTLLILGMQFP